jgi:hypothetical protein
MSYLIVGVPVAHPPATVTPMFSRFMSTMPSTAPAHVPAHVLVRLHCRAAIRILASEYNTATAD